MSKFITPRVIRRIRAGEVFAGRRETDKVKTVNYIVTKEDEPRSTFFSRVKGLMFSKDLGPTRFFLAVGAIMIGLGMSLPSEIFPTAAQIEAGTGRNTYLIMAQIAPEWAWSIAFSMQGYTILWSLLSGYTSKALLWLEAAFGVVLWTTAIGACYLAYWNGWGDLIGYKPPAIMGGGFASVLASLWVFVRYHCDKGEK